MNIAAYCRVSTDKQDQLNSLEAQKRFFSEYTERTGNNLVKIYADEGISGTKIKNRKQFLKMMSDAENGMFQTLVVKDISRFARNTVDLLESIRKLKSWGIETLFLTSNMTSMGNSEFVLTIFGALAQEESRNTSSRVKFGKKLNAEKGRVPNFVYGYDKTCGDIFNLKINEREAECVKKMFHLYLEEGYGTSKIAHMLNEAGITTKRNCQWTQNAVCRILKNEIYIGKIINGKVEVEDFLTGKRIENPSEKWMVKDRPDLQIIDTETFELTQKTMRERGNKFKVEKQRHSNQHIFSTLIRCKECGKSFRRTMRTYKNTYVKWVCSSRNGIGTWSCPNATSIDEDELIGVIENYFKSILKNKEKTLEYVVRKFEKIYQSKDRNIVYKEELEQDLKKIKNRQDKYKNMYVDGIITRKELKEKIDADKTEKERLEYELKLIKSNLSKGEILKNALKETFKRIEDITDLKYCTNAELRKILDRIEVDKEGNVEIYLKPLKTIGIVETVPDCNYRTQGCNRTA